ncbi:hypothetical protein K502DRAFT_329706 [Neoconidiobolus thromboides FSU 785]|nr:hypothetical protein K502DRAFT_329706 [Neoconidiobolus thromboides FSU 785]
MEDSVVINEIPRIEEIPRFNENLILNEMNTNKRQSISLKNDNGLIRPLKREIVNEVEIIKDLIYVLQGIDGKYIQYDHNLKTNDMSNDMNQGLILQSIYSFINNELKEYYGIIANIENELVNEKKFIKHGDSQLTTLINRIILYYAI